jgi:alkaline phosphatase D
MKDKRFIQRLNRRSFIKNSVVISTGVALSGSLLVACKEDDNPSIDDGDFGFLEGVASFDPSQDQVILWTRYTPSNSEINNPEVFLDVATNEDFLASSLVASENVVVDIASDYTIHVDVQNLQANTTYFYRFRSEKSGTSSVVGQTKTLPAAGQVSHIKTAVVSCANYQSGLFNVYGAVAASDADIVVHLGDYIYEYGVGEYGSNPITELLQREHQPAGEIISLDDYRERYRQYRSDPQLQEAHRLKPFICVWDDHEIANDAYRNGAQNHQANEGDYESRKLSALQAWHEYLPARVDDQAKIYRSFDLGGIANLMMLDTRVIGRDKQLNYADYLTPDGNINAASFITDWLAPDRTILGAEQKAWLMNQIADSTANWQVLGSQVLMGRYNVPVELLSIISGLTEGNIDPANFEAFQIALEELVAIKTRIIDGDPTVTDEERARVETVFPYNLDGWDGYPVERDAVLDSAANKKLISLAGDTHNAWHSVLTDSNGNKVGTELATASVSSPGLEAFLGIGPTVKDTFKNGFELLVDDLQFVDVSQRGYLMVDYAATEVKANWHFIKDLIEKDTFTAIEHTAVEV